jgi:hypothetical protein
MKTRGIFWLLVAFFTSASVLLAEEKTLSYIENPNWRPAASKLLEVVTGDRYDTGHILDLRPEKFDDAQPSGPSGVRS